MHKLKNQNNQTDFYLNPAQLRCILADPKELYALMGRGTGKSTEILGHLTLNRVFDMPRASFLILGRTYKQIKTRTLPGTVLGWEKRGMVEGKHFVIGKKPPANWPRAYFAPIDDYSHFISFYTGTGFHLGSQDRPGLVNSLTVWGIFGDEAKLLNEERFKEDAAATNRGNPDAFPGNPHNRGIWLTSSMPPIPEGNWLYNMEERMDPKQIADILQIAFHIEQKKQELPNALNERQRNGILNKIEFYNKWLNRRRQDSVYYTEASSLANIHILRLDHIKQMQEILKGKFNPEILNLRPRHAVNSFYSKLSPIHFYNDFNYSNHYDRYDYKQIADHENCKGDNDLVKNKKLIIGMDFGARINCIVTAQRLDSLREIRFLKNHFVTSPEIIDDVVNLWCKYYEEHNEREIDMWYDSTGNNRVPNSRDSYAQQARKLFEKNGWDVNLKTKGGTNPLHNKKFLLWNLMLSERENRFYKVRINETNCSELKASLQFAPAIEATDGEIKKDKSSERKKNIPPEEATDLSDAADNIIYGEFSTHIHEISLPYHDIMIR
jgi:hypothetical protein